MDRHVVIYLQHEQPGTHGVHDAPTTTQLMRYAVKRSVGRSEFYQAGTIGLQPSAVFVLALAEEYDGELKLKYENKIYDIIRSYETEDGGVELTAQRSDTP